MNARNLHPRTIAIAIYLTVALGSQAQADDGQPRYVSGAGSDKGDCLNRFRPCRTLEYAIARSGKSDYIRVAEGDYTVDDADSLSKVLSVPGRLEGGFSKYSGYAERNATKKTLLIGVPPEFRERFEQAGFSVIVDRKGLAQDEAAEMRKLTQVVLASEKSHSAAPCVSNQAAGFPCQSVSLLSHLSLQDLRPSSQRGNDVWGFTDLNTNREYAVMGLQRGVAVVDVTDPEGPEIVGTASGSATTWRDIKIYQLYDADAKRWRAYAYVTADNVPDSLMVLDLSNLPNAIEQVQFASDFTDAHNAYLVNADYSYGLAQTPQAPRLGISGGRANNGRHRLYTLSNPRAPARASISTAGYAHDLASFPIRDARKDSQCLSAQTEAVCQVLSDFNENTVDIWDVTNPASPQSLASFSYTNASYVHSGWWTEDGRYLFVHDELDESNFGLNTTVRVFSMANLRSPTQIGTWSGPTRAIDHNGFVKGNRYYIANYSEGLTILDITNPASPQRLGYFDTYPSTSETGFVGAWGVYPFFPSGTIAVGDINTGLYLLRNETLSSPSGTFSVSASNSAAEEGESVAITVSRTGSAVDATSVELEVLHASTEANDVSLSTSTLMWAAGDGAPKTATLTLAQDSVAEGLERALIRLKAPQGGASIGFPDTVPVDVSDVGAASRLRLLESSIRVDDARGKVLVTVTRQSSAQGEARASYRTHASSSFAGFTPAQGELVWLGGDAAAKTIEVTLDPTALSGGQTGTFDVELSNAVGAELETTAGAGTGTLLATITVADSSTSPPANPPPSTGGGNGGGGGGGTLQLLWVLLLAPLALGRIIRRQSSYRA